MITFNHFKEAMAPAYCYQNGADLFFAKMGNMVVKYDAPMNEFLIYHELEQILDGADIHTAKAFVRLAELTQRELKEKK